MYDPTDSREDFFTICALHNALLGKHRTPGILWDVKMHLRMSKVKKTALQRLEIGRGIHCYMNKPNEGTEVWSKS